MDARFLRETLRAGNYEPDDEQTDGENMSREKLYFETNPRRRRSGKILAIRNPLALHYLCHPAAGFRVRRTLCPPANEPTAVALLSPSGTGHALRIEDGLSAEAAGEPGRSGKLAQSRMPTVAAGWSDQGIPGRR